MHDDGAGSEILIPGTEDGSGVEDDGIEALGGGAQDLTLGAVFCISVGPLLGGIVPGVALIHDGQSLVGFRGALWYSEGSYGGGVNEPPNSALPGGGEDIVGALDVAGGHLFGVGPASDTTAAVVNNLDVPYGESERIGLEEISLH
jgi:hypothetical protein